MKRTDYAYVAARINPDHSQNLGDYSIGRRGSGQYYHYDSKNRRLINRTALVVIGRNSRIYNECLKAIGRLQAEEVSGE
ncbi:hypothetical protein PBI_MICHELLEMYBELL_53 [Mycobacterium phage MichelleMyBell]|uniref:Uncharacterized protein n=1 Tax=Mycobacterium phage MichelleMyBell TaxID=1445726 RepID=W0LPX9_9CAUD|nr:hypothetical protein CH20_gp53 [Mycobacterium phage MichelleMyBell]AHG24374.1 hypothetical protein PBI_MICHELLEMYBELL_53 [Mycobacterium phage MichelleMyBell]